ncbi:MAG: hypothetical protein CM15mV144_170 [Caudoviricetes sp.]|nr:MAG: hypothetical protein CM15mV144_170 [Caudoviricetes sp.]
MVMKLLELFTGTPLILEIKVLVHEEDTDISGEDTRVQAIANATWTDDVKSAYETLIDSQELPG